MKNFIRFFKYKIKIVLRLCKIFMLVTKNKFKGYTNECELLSYNKFGYAPTTNIMEYMQANAIYSNAKIFQKYSKTKFTIPAVIEHGVYFGTGNSNEAEIYDLPTIITYSSLRKKNLRKKYSKAVFPIGPYIFYAEGISKEEFKNIKSSLGKTILVFPVHSVEQMDISYDNITFIDNINKIKKELCVDTVLVSLYFKDIVKYAPIYENAGFTVVCSGFRTDKTFLSRQKSYIELSDYVITNGLGTHIGYSVLLNKPVSFIKQNIDYSFENESVKTNMAACIDEKEMANDVEIITKMFSGVNTQISKEQREIVNLYWGLDYLRTPEELNRIFTISKEIFRKSCLSRKSYKELFEMYRDKSKDELTIKLINEALE